VSCGFTDDFSSNSINLVVGVSGDECGDLSAVGEVLLSIAASAGLRLVPDMMTGFRKDSIFQLAAKWMVVQSN